jgi:methyl-accepting chemotaxis protein
MSRQRIRILLTHKIAAIGAIGLLGVALVGGIYFIKSRTQNAYMLAADQTNAISSRNDSLSLKLLESRRSEKDFLLRNDPKYVDRVRELATQVDGDVAALRKQSDEAGLTDLSKQIGAVGDGFKTYITHFMTIADAKRRLGLNENSGLEGTLRDSVHAIESKLGEFDEPRLLVKMLMMRRHEKDFMLRRDVKYGADLNKRAAEFTALLEASSIPPSARIELRQKLDAYQRDFAAWMAAANDVANAQRETSAAYAAIEPIIERINKTVRELNANATAANLESRADTALQIQSAIVLIALLVSGFAWWIGRSIARPVTAITGVMGQLAQGNLEVAVPGSDRNDELGAMAKAVLVFRDSAIERDRLEAQARDQKSQAEAMREAATAKVMNEFDAAVGGIVKAALAGDFSQRVPLEGKDGIIRNLAHALNTMCDNLGKAFDDMVRMLAALSKGDLTARITANYQGAFASLKDNANATAHRLSETVAEIKLAAREVSSASAEIATSTSNLSQRTEEQAASLERTSAAMEEIASIVKKNAENAQQASQRASHARGAADHGGQVVTSAVEAMSRIDGASQKMADIISVIDEIARQTNLLALNAAVEAARAGEAGRGFAVVATEVRSLAQRASQAAKDINELITNSSGQVREGVELVNRAGTALNEIVGSIKSVADIVSDIASASAEQATGLDQIKEALTEMDTATQQNSALVEENAATAKTLADQSAAMGEQVGFFQTEDMRRSPGRPRTAA